MADYKWKLSYLKAQTDKHNTLRTASSKKAYKTINIRAKTCGRSTDLVDVDFQRKKQIGSVVNI